MEAKADTTPFSKHCTIVKLLKRLEKFGATYCVTAEACIGVATPIIKGDGTNHCVNVKDADQLFNLVSKLEAYNNNLRTVKDVKDLILSM